MPTDRPNNSDGATGGGQLFEFVDHAHEVTEEERNRPRYGRPVRKPTAEAAEQRQADESPRPSSES